LLASLAGGAAFLAASALLSAVDAPGVPAASAEPADPTPAAATPAPAKRWDLAALPLVYYQPETSVGVAGQLVLVRVASSGDALQDRHDTISATLTATYRRQYAIDVSGTKYWHQDGDRLTLELLGERYPNIFWGLGNDTPESAADHYTPIAVGGRANYSHRLIERIFGGVNTTVGYYEVESFTPGGAVADFLATRRRQGWLVGVGPNLQRDTRDDSNFPRAGNLTTLTLTAYRPAWLSDYSFVELDVDQRTFVSLPLRSVLALQAYGQWIVGQAPIDLLPALGGPLLLRGYYQGRYRDNVYLAGQAEWRVPLFWRLGGALFAAAGDVYPDLAAIGLAEVKGAAGLGLRLNVGRTNPINIRLDGALASGSSGVYLVIGEAI
jgi:outer membrane protein assembly factor BamA